MRIAEDWIRLHRFDPARIGASLGSRVQHFLDGGGRYAISMVLALLAIALFRTVASRLARATPGNE